MAAETARVIYSFVARKTTVLVEHATSVGNFRSVALQCLETLPSNNKKFSLSQKGYTLNYLIEDTFAVMVLCDKNVPQPVAFEYLTTLKTEFLRDFRSEAETAQSLALQQAYGARLQEHMKVAESAAELAIKKEQKDSKDLAKSAAAAAAAEKVTTEGEGSKQVDPLAKQMSILDKKVETAKDFKARSKEIQQKMLWDRCAFLIILVVVFTLGSIIWVTVCHGISCHITNTSTF